MDREITALEQQLTEYRQSPTGLAVVLILNCSSPMNSHLILERLAAREIVDRVKSSQTYIALIQYGNNVELVQDFTLDHSRVNMQLVSLKPIGGSNRNLHGALLQAESVIRILGPERRKLVVVLTDTCNSHATEQATIMRNAHVDFMCIGIGPAANNADLMGLASTINYYYPLPSMDNLTGLFTARANANFVEPSLEKNRVYEHQASFILDFKTPGVVSVELQQHTEDRWVTLYTKAIPSLKQTSIVLERKGLVPETSYTFQATIKTQGGQILTSSPITVKTRKTNPLSLLLSNNEKLSEAVQRLKNKLADFSQQFLHVVRIGMVGKVGNGKSSVTNSIYAIFNGDFEFVNITGVIGERSLTSHPMPVEIPNTKLELLDFYGWDEHHKFQSDIRFLIQGLAPDTLHEGQTLSPEFKAAVEGQNYRRFYGVFIVVSPAEVAQAQHLAYVQGLYDFISRQGLQPIILLTKCDQIDTDLAENPEFIYSSDLVDDYIQQLTTKKFPRGMIFPVISYFEPPQYGLNTVKDYLLLSALHALVFSSMKPVLIREHVLQNLRASLPPGSVMHGENRIDERRMSMSHSSQSSHTHSSNGPQSLHVSQLPPQHVGMADSHSTELSNSQNPSGDSSVNINAFVVNARRNAGNEISYKRCVVRTKDMEGLRQAIAGKFGLSTPPFKIYELKNGYKVDIEDDDDVLGLANDATLEFNA